MAKVEVLNFEEIMSPSANDQPEEPQEEYEEDDQGQGRYLNEIEEVDASNEENNSPVNPQRKRSKLMAASSEEKD